MTKIALAGFHHETNTFSSHPTTLTEFLEADNWPGLTLGADYYKVFAEGNIPTVGFIQKAHEHNVELVPLTFANAEPSGKVTRQAYEYVVGEILNGLRNAGNIDALYLDLHGAMVCEHVDDGEGELVRRVREVVGEALPIVVTHDLHANVSDELFALTDAIISYQTYPHIDMYDTGARAADFLLTYLKRNAKCYKAMHRLDFIIPLNAQCTLLAPNKSIYSKLCALEKQYNVLISFNPCFPLADTTFTTPTLLAFGYDQVDTKSAVDELKQFIDARRDAFHVKLYSEQEAIDYFNRLPENSGLTIFADTQDNPGAGGLSNTMGIFKALVQQKVQNAAVAIVWDTDAAALCHDKGLGQTVVLTLGDEFNGEFLIEKLAPGQFVGTGDFYKDLNIDLGPMVLLSHQGIRLIVSSKKMQAADQAIFTHMDLNPSDFDLLVLKSSVHFRADFTTLASHILPVISRGENIADLSKLRFQNCPLAMSLATSESV